MTISARLPAQRQHLSRRRRPTLIVDDHLGSAARRAAAPLVVDDHLGSAASRAAAPLIVDDHLASATSRAAAPLTVDDPFSSATGGAKAPSWLALHIQAQRFKPSIDRRRPHSCGDAEVQLGDKAGASRSSPAPTRRRHHCEDTEVQPDDEAGASSSSPAAAAIAGRRRADHPEELRGAGELTCNSAPEHALARMSVHALPDRCKCTRIARLAS